MFTKVQLSDLRLNKCKLTFRLDNRASLSIRYFCAYHTLNISAQKTDITLFKSPDSQEIESILGKELIGRYDPTSFGKIGSPHPRRPHLKNVYRSKKIKE